MKLVKYISTRKKGGEKIKNKIYNYLKANVCTPTGPASGGSGCIILWNGRGGVV